MKNIMLNLNLSFLDMERSRGGGTCNVRIYRTERQRGHSNWIFMAKTSKIRNPNIRLYYISTNTGAHRRKIVIRNIGKSRN